MAKSRVLIFSLAQSSSSVGGAEVAVKEITDRLADRFEFEIISADIESLWSKYFFPISGYRRACRLHQENKFDLVWAIMANQAGMAASLFKKKFPAVPFLLTLQEGDDLDSLAYRVRLLAPRLFKVFKRADQIQAISNYLAKWAKAMGAACLVTVVPNGVDFEKIKSSGQNSKVVITTSRLVAKNGVGDLIEAMRFLPENVRLMIVGSGPLERNLKLKTKSYKLEPRVTFVGAVSPDQIPDYLSRADIFARPSLSEGLGNSFLEAMAAGLPTIGTPVGGIPDFLKDGETGWLTPVNSPQILAEKIKFILDPANQDQVNRVTAAGQKLARDNYNWPAVAEKMEAVFNGLI